MKKIWMVVMFAAIIAGVGLIPATVSAGGPYERSDGYDEERYVPRAVYPSNRHVSSYRRDTRSTIYRRSNASDGMEAQDDLSCVKRVVRESRHREVERGDCRKPVPARTIHETTVVVNCPKNPPARHVPKPKKVERCCTDPCANLDKISRMSFEIQKLESRLEAAQESARVNWNERQKMEVELATWRERERGRQVWDNGYGEWRHEFFKWKDRTYGSSKP